MTLFRRSNPQLSDIILNEDNIVIERLLNGGSSDMNVDGSSTAVTFKAVPSAGKYWMIARVMIYFSGGTAFSEDKFGNLTALTNGVDVLCNGTVIVNWKNNMDIQTSMFDADGKAVYAKADRSISGRLSFSKFGDKNGLRIDDEVNGFGIKIQDALQSLSQFKARIQGIEYNKV